MTVESIIDAATLSEHRPNCYFLGPFARRVSFFSQQRRAVNLVAALRVLKLVTPGQRVAVIGGGLAGLVSAAGFLGMRCKVDLFEVQDELLKHQSKAAHRFIHPSISRWPDIQRPISDATNFMFFDWFASPCDRLVSIFAQEWRDIREMAAKAQAALGMEPLLSVHLKTTVLELLSDPQAPEFGVGLVTSPPTRTPEYDAVIVTAGFGKENHIKGLPFVSYWDEDTLDEVAKEQVQWIVSGCGDGGLIDSLRLTYQGFEGGRLAIEIAKMIASSLDLTKIVQAELRWRLTNDDAAMRNLQSTYNAAIGQFPDTIVKKLDEGLEQTITGKVRLFALESAPFSPNAAPIHKLMLAYALRKKKVGFHSAKLLADADCLKIDYGHGPLSPPPHAGLTIRHGPVAELPGLLLPHEAQLLNTKQSSRADYIDDEPSCELDPPPGYPSATGPSRPAFIGLRRALAERFVQSIDTQAHVDATQDGFEYALPNGREISVPDTIFGIPIRPARATHDAKLL
jgi:hypothetical protein